MESRSRGKLIVLEGADGSGKSTQFRLLYKRLERERIPFETLKFPQYGAPSGALVEAYLAGKFGKNPADISPYAASLFYALDRWTAAPKIRGWLREGKLVLLDRYTDSNVGHQGAKIKNPKARKKFVNWLYDIEHRLLAIPEPDLVIILSTAQSLEKPSATGGKNLDIHEKDKAYTTSVRATYRWLARAYPKRCRLIPVSTPSRVRPPEEVQGEVWRVLKPLL